MSEKKSAAEDKGDTLVEACLMMLDDDLRAFDSRCEKNIAAQRFGSLACLFLRSFARTCLQLGAIDAGRDHNIDQASTHWGQAERVLGALKRALDARAALSEAELPGADEAIILEGHFLEAQSCFLFQGSRRNLATLHELLAFPFVVYDKDNNREGNILSAEVRIRLAAWKGEMAEVESMGKVIALHHKRYKIATTYPELSLDLWRAVAARDAAALDALLPHAEAAYRKSGKRREYDFWGGGQPYNEVMFDFTTTSVLKIARALGMTWEYGNDYTAQIWPSAVIERWVD